MVRKLELESGKLILSEDEIEGFLERTVTPIGTSGKADIPRRYIGRRVYVIVIGCPRIHEMFDNRLTLFT